MKSEIYKVQNPAIGAAILWRFVYGYAKTQGEAVPFPLLFIVLPIIFRDDLCAVIDSTQRKKGLSKVSEKLFIDKKSDEIYVLNNSAIKMRQLTLSSFNIGVATGLFQLNHKSATVYYCIDKGSNYLSDSTMRLLRCAEKLGNWCSELTLSEISSWLKVRF